MPTIVPSQVVQFIDTALQEHLGGPPIYLHPRVCGQLNTLLRLIKQLPNSLLPRDSQTYTQFVQGQESIRFAVKKAQDRNERISSPPALPADGDGRRTQVQVIREALAGCPDEIPPRHSKELLFIKDPTPREVLLIDLEAVRSALSHAEWKAATVLAGSLVEALLLWAIQQKQPADIQMACAARKLNPKLPTDLSDIRWSLHEFVEVAEQFTLIEPDTAKQARLAKDFRNLIHPGRALRTQQACDRGTALAASAAVELVSRDLQVRFP